MERVEAHMCAMAYEEGSGRALLIRNLKRNLSHRLQVVDSCSKHFTEDFSLLYSNTCEVTRGRMENA